MEEEGKEGGRNKARKGKSEVGGEEKELIKSSAKASLFFFLKRLDSHPFKQSEQEGKY